MTNSAKKNYDFSNQPSYNGEESPRGYELVPAVLTKDLEEFLRKKGLLYTNVRTSHMPNGAKVPTVYIPNPIGGMEAAIKTFNADVKRYLKHTDDQKIDALSLDEMMDNIDDEDEKGFDPTGTTENEDQAMLWMTLDLLKEDLDKIDPKYGKILMLLAEGYDKKDIFTRVDLGKGKTQAYDLIKKIQDLAKANYYKNYRD